jgi:hypothetical protein
VKYTAVPMMVLNGGGMLRGGLGLLAVTLALAGCGGGSSGTSTIDLRSPAVRSDGVIKSRYRCGAGSLWLPLEWGPVPSDTKELVAYIGRFKYKDLNGARKLVVPFGDLITHIKPSRRNMPANTFPPGVGWAAFGPISCPLARRGQNVLLELFALDRTRANWELKGRLATRLTEEALDQDGPSTSSKSPGKLTQDALAAGHLVATYGPRSP